jgi:putative flavoprotein involved in K+ transport
MPRTTTVIIGAGQAGLAMSRCLSRLGVEHVVLERGQVAQRWRTQSWDSLRLLTPNWMTRLPGFQYVGPDPDGFMGVPELVAFLERYADTSNAPVLTETAVTGVERECGGYRVTTDRGVWHAQSVVIATGYCERAFVPEPARRVPGHILQIAAPDYKRPGDLPSGGVLVVGASATGVQIADELQRSGRPVVLSAGRHLRMPRQYRGADILWWLDRLGVLSRPAGDVYSLVNARRQPSMQLAGGADHRSIDLGTLHDLGVRVRGRLLEVEGHGVWFGDDLAATTAAADVKLAELLERVDEFIARSATLADPRPPFAPTWPLGVADTAGRMRLDREGIETIVWATGYRRAYPWLHVPVLDAFGEIAHSGGVTDAAGLYVLGMNIQRRRNSSLIDGVGDDARTIAGHLAQLVAGRRVA